MWNDQICFQCTISAVEICSNYIIMENYVNKRIRQPADTHEHRQVSSSVPLHLQSFQLPEGSRRCTVWSAGSTVITNWRAKLTSLLQKVRINPQHMLMLYALACQLKQLYSRISINVLSEFKVQSSLYSQALEHHVSGTVHLAMSVHTEGLQHVSMSANVSGLLPDIVAFNLRWNQMESASFHYELFRSGHCSKNCQRLWKSEATFQILSLSANR